MLLILLFSLSVLLDCAPTDLREKNMLEEQKKFNQIIKDAYKKRHSRDNEEVILSVSDLDFNSKNNETPVISKINAEISEYLYQGDILLTEEEALSIARSIEDEGERSKRQATLINNIWKTSEPIPYFFRSNFPSSRIVMVRKGIEFWMENTCLSFVENNVAQDRIEFISGSGCNSYIGRTGGVQQLSLHAGCENMGSITHEIMHALGFWHHHSRADRDNYIVINSNNINSNNLYNYYKQSLSLATLLNLPYDYGSVMHYHPYAFAIDSKKYTIIAKKPNFQGTMGQREGPSFSDVLAVNKFYNCTSKCPTQLNCLNGGYTDPRNCNRCKCPYYFSGPLCGARAPGTAQNCNGAILQATTSWQSFTATAGSPSGTNTFDTFNCNWHIKAQAGRKVEFRMTTASNQIHCEEPCMRQSIEINRGNVNINGFITCCTTFLNKVFTSEQNVMYIRGVVRNNLLTFVFQYRFV